MKSFSMKKSIKLRITVLFLTIVLILTSLLTVILYNQTSLISLKEAADRAYNTAQQTSKLIDTNEFIKLRTIEDEATASYIKIREDLIKVREISGAKYVYTMRKTDEGDFMYVVDGSSDEDLSHIGDIEESAPEYEQTESVTKSGEKYKLIDGAMKGSQQAIAEENSAATEEVTSSTVQQATSIKDLSEASENLSKLAQDLQSTILKFRM